MKSKKSQPDFKAQLLAEMGRDNMNIVITAIDDKVEYFQEIIQLLLHGDPPLPMRAAWVVTICLEQHPEWIKPHIDKLIDMLPVCDHPGTRRSLLRSLSDSRIHIPVKKEGFLMDLCFEWLQDPETPIAIRVYSMEILFRLSEKYPDLRHELSEIIQAILPHASAGIRSRAGKILKKLKK